MKNRTKRGKTKHSAAIILMDDNGYVAVARRLTGKHRKRWGFPGGTVEAGESSLLAAVRELAEETGCSVTAESLVLISQSIRRRAGKGPERQVYDIYLLSLGGRPALDNPESHKCGGWKWVSPSFLTKRQRQMVPGHKPGLEAIWQLDAAEVVANLVA